MYSSKSKSGHRRWTVKQRQRLLARFHDGHMTQRDFAGRHGATVSKWLRVESDATSPPMKFLEATLPQSLAKERDLP